MAAGLFGACAHCSALALHLALNKKEKKKKKKKKKKNQQKKKTFAKKRKRRAPLTWRFFFHFARISRVLSKQKNRCVSTQAKCTKRKKKKKKKKKKKIFLRCGAMHGDATMPMQFHTKMQWNFDNNNKRKQKNRKNSYFDTNGFDDLSVNANNQQV
jgi:hypothetical protein